MDIKFSIIIPAYNSAKYLNRCIDSVAKQDLPFDYYEAIVVNDGSTDNTLEILEKLSAQYSFLKFISIPNCGVSIARNTGIKESLGEFILFLDADDSIASNCLSNIYQEMCNNLLDMLLMNHQWVRSDGIQTKGMYHIERNNVKVVSGKEFLLKGCYPPMVPLYAYRRSFINKNKLQLLPIRHEDEEFIPKAIYQACRIKYYPFNFYNYFQNEGSFMNAYKESNFYDMVTAMSSLNKFKQEHSDDKEVKVYFDSHIANRLMMIFKRSIRDGYNIQDKLIQKMKEEHLYPLRPRKASIYTLLFNYSPTLFERYYRFVKRKPKLKIE